MTALVLDAQALSLLSTLGSGSSEVLAAVHAAANKRKPVIVPAVLLAELLRGASRSAPVNRLLNQQPNAVTVRDTDRPLAGLVGGVLHAADAGSEDIVDAHCVAVLVENGGGVVLTSDTSDLKRLAAPYANLHIETV